MIEALSIRRKFRARTAILVAALVFVLTMAGAALLAQEHSAPPTSKTQKGSSQPLPPSEKKHGAGYDVDQGTGGELAEASREAAGEDENNFNQYPSVMFLAHMLHIRPVVAFWISILFNFAVIAGGIAYLLKKHLPGAFRNRSSAIQRGMAEAQKASEEARRRLSEIENRLSRLDAEIAAMRENAEREAVSEEAKIRAAAEEDTRKIIESAEQEIAAAANVARRELKAYAANIAVELAQQQLHLDANTDEALIKSFAAQLNKNGSGAPKSGKDGR
ncbi:MAG TPA: ATP synthase F0 subunit B [Terriglobales bacterium]|nr:ATP synthase F0 subunit B [Terriglobales bacterium]